jgi:hypothetical protein
MSITNSKNSKKSVPPVKCANFDSSCLSFTDLDIDNERNKAQMISYPRYTHQKHGESSYIFQTDWIQLTQYGLPKKGSEPGDFYMNDTDRTFLKIPLDPEQESCQHLQDMLLKVDDYIETNKADIFKTFAASKKTTGVKAAKLFTYQPIVRKPQDENEFGETIVDDKKKEKFLYCKMQFNTSYPEKDITSMVFIRDENDKTQKSNVPATVSSATDLENVGLVWGSKVRMIVMVNKLWAAKAKDNNGSRRFGVTMKILQMEVIPREKSGSIKEQFTRYAFIDQDDEDEEEDTMDVEEAEEEVVEAGAEDMEVEDDVEDDVEEEAEEDELETGVEVVNADEELEEEDEELEEEEEEEEEEVKPKKKLRTVRK